MHAILALSAMSCLFALVRSAPCPQNGLPDWAACFCADSAADVLRDDCGAGREPGVVVDGACEPDEGQGNLEADAKELLPCDFCCVIAPREFPAGTAGTSGSTGADGTTGSSGVDGTAGARGTRGVAGTNGVAGVVGTSGLTGTAGTIGAIGTAGAPSVQGTAGLRGVRGAAGIAGAIGAPGAAESLSCAVTAATASGLQNLELVIDEGLCSLNHAGFAQKKRAQAPLHTATGAIVRIGASFAYRRVSSSSSSSASSSSSSLSSASESSSSVHRCGPHFRIIIGDKVVYTHSESAFLTRGFASGFVDVLLARGTYRIELDIDAEHCGDDEIAIADVVLEGQILEDGQTVIVERAPRPLLQ